MVSKDIVYLRQKNIGIMILQSSFSALIDSQKQSFMSMDTGIPREVLPLVPIADGFATIITGIRRCGKSTLLLQIFKQKYNDAIFINFDDPRLAGMEEGDFARLSNEILARGTTVLFFDEIQIVKGWEIFVHQLLRDGHKVFLTGSNASLLSKELGTHLTGRHLSVEMFPFSYNEYLAYRQLEKSQKSYTDYLGDGGMPDYLRTRMPSYLNDLLDDILIRDIAVRHNIKDVDSLRQLCTFLLTNIGNPISANRLSGMFGIKSASTLMEYFSYLQDSYLLEFVPLFDYSAKKRLRNPKKVYAIDLGIRNQNDTSFTSDTGHIFENAVYMSLRRQFKEIYYYKGKGECDFVAVSGGKVKRLVQACAALDDGNIDRETNGLYEAMKASGQKEGYIMTFGQTDTFTNGGLTIHVSPAFKYEINSSNEA